MRRYCPSCCPSPPSPLQIVVTNALRFSISIPHSFSPRFLFSLSLFRCAYPFLPLFPLLGRAPNSTIPPSIIAFCPLPPFFVQRILVLVGTSYGIREDARPWQHWTLLPSFFSSVSLLFFCTPVPRRHSPRLFWPAAPSFARALTPSTRSFRFATLSLISRVRSYNPFSPLIACL